MKYLIPTLCAFAFVYSLFAYVTLEVNPLAWGVETRVGFALFAFLWVGTAFSSWGLSK